MKEMRALSSRGESGGRTAVRARRWRGSERRPQKECGGGGDRKQATAGRAAVVAWHGAGTAATWRQHGEED
ncbi:hypothetical protein Scep_005242 [Stephania cephalantha]|uniref:Uncharacterized protein n=1 Tax=Stephania cephalantha TaxID=152367 RepID=A0AAP0KTX5_9MAGN